MTRTRFDPEWFLVDALVALISRHQYASTATLLVDGEMILSHFSVQFTLTTTTPIVLKKTPSQDQSGMTFANS